MAPRKPTPLVLCAALALSGCNDQRVFAPPTAPSAALAAASEPGRYVLGFDGPASIAPDVLATSGGEIVDAIPALNALVVDGVTNPDALWAAQPTYVDAGFEVFVAPILGDRPILDALGAVPAHDQAPWFKNDVQWDMKAMHADDGWAMTSGGDGMKVCIIDTGVDDQHQELSGGKVLERANFVTSPAGEAGPTLVWDPHGHGTHVAGLSAAKGVVLSGVAPRANVLSARVLNASGSGSETAIMNGIIWCADRGAHVINLSLGGTRYRALPGYVASINAYTAAVKYATDRGSVVVVSAGNSNLSLPNSARTVVPAQVPGTIIVGATGPLTKSTAPPPPAWNAFDPAQAWRSPDYKAYYSNFGTGVHVFAPGGRGGVPLSESYRFYNGVPQGGPNDQIWSVCSGQSSFGGVADNGGVPGSMRASCSGTSNRYLDFAGTSQAAPHVAGLAALLYNELGGALSDANRLRIEACIKNTTDIVGPVMTYGGGRINVKKAIDAIRANAC